MTIHTSTIKWGSYGPYEGPWYSGSIKYKLPVNPTKDDLLIEVVTATEGGCYDMINMYDRCVISVGLIQLCEAKYFLTTKLLNKIATEVSPVIITIALREALERSDAEFKKNDRNLYRFFQHGIEVTTVEQQKELFLSSSGLKREWTFEQKHHAMTWAANMSNLLRNEASFAVQRKFCASVLNGVVMPRAKKTLFSDEDMFPSEGWPGAVRAVYMSFAANLPETADNNLQIAVDKSNFHKYTKSWCIEIMQQLTFGPEIKIYSERYDKLVPVIERQYEIVMPKNFSELKNWKPTILTHVPVQLSPVQQSSDVEKDIEILTEDEQIKPIEEVTSFPLPANVPTDLMLTEKSFWTRLIELIKKFFF